MAYVGLSQTADPSFQYKINQSAVFHYLRKSGPVYKKQIADALDISLPSVTRTLDHLIETGFVGLTEVKKNGNGRTVPYYQAIMKNRIVVSIDLLKNVISARDMETMHSIVPFRLNERKHLTGALVEVIDEYVASTEQCRGMKVSAVCIASPGIVNVERGVVEKAIYHPGFEQVPVRDDLEKHYGCTVFLDNVVNLAAFANYCEFDRECSNIVSCDIGLEIGAGLVIDGHVYRGQNYIAGEVGYYTDSISDPELNYKRLYTFRGLYRDMIREFQLKDNPEREADADTCLEKIRELFTLAHEKDARALAVMKRYVENIALMLNKIEILLDPKKVVIGGDICLLPFTEEVFLYPLIACHDRIKKTDDELCYSRYGTLVALRGACDMALEKYLSTEFPYVMM